MPQNLLFSFLFHISVIVIAVVSLPFIAKKPIDIPPLVSVELIQITDQTNIPFAPKAEKIIEKRKLNIDKNSHKKENDDINKKGIDAFKGDVCGLWSTGKKCNNKECNNS